MEHGTQADYDLVCAHEESIRAAEADRVLDWLKAMDGDSPYQVSRLGHSLQTASRAERDGADDETIFCALLHDIGEILAPANHSQAHVCPGVATAHRPAKTGYRLEVLVINNRKLAL